MFQLKRISIDSIPAALEKAERYRLLNEPKLTESICLDVLDADPGNSRAVVMMILAITDQFGTTTPDLSHAKQLLAGLKDDYEKNYYGGIVCERQGKAILNQNIPDAGFIAYEWFRDAMEYYEKAEAVRPAGNDDSILRWNTCARLIDRNHLHARDERYVEPQLE